MPHAVAKHGMANAVVVVLVLVPVHSGFGLWGVGRGGGFVWPPITAETRRISLPLSLPHHTRSNRSSKPPPPHTPHHAHCAYLHLRSASVWKWYCSTSRGHGAGTKNGWGHLPPLSSLISLHKTHAPLPHATHHTPPPHTTTTTDARSPRPANPRLRPENPRLRPRLPAAKPPAPIGELRRIPQRASVAPTTSPTSPQRHTPPLRHTTHDPRPLHAPHTPGKQAHLPGPSTPRPPPPPCHASPTAKFAAHNRTSPACLPTHPPRHAGSSHPPRPRKASKGIPTRNLLPRHHPPPPPLPPPGIILFVPPFLLPDHIPRPHPPHHPPLPPMLPPPRHIHAHSSSPMDTLPPPRPSHATPRHAAARGNIVVLLVVYRSEKPSSAFLLV